MKLATLRTDTGTVAVRIDAAVAVEIPAPSVGALLERPDWRAVAEAADGASHPLDAIEPRRWHPVVPRPGKIICVGLNYRNHIAEMGHGFPEFPTLFAKFAEALIGPFDDIELPAGSSAVDWEGELAVVIGRTARNVSAEEAPAHIAGYAILNDVTARDYQNRTAQWLQGKTFEHTSPFGPYLVTADEFAREGAVLRTRVDGQLMQEASTGDLLFSPTMLVSYISAILTLNPGDVISTGTPGGVGHARTPRRYLAPGSLLETSIDGLGGQRNTAAGPESSLSIDAE